MNRYPGLVKSLIIVFVLFSSAAFAGHKKATPVHVLSTRSYIFYFKVQKEWVGGTVEVIDEAQNTVASERVDRMKHIVDFFFLPPGNYTVKIKKGTEEFEFCYANPE